MPVDTEALRALVSSVGEFYVTRRGMKKAQQTMTALLKRGEISDDAVRRYVAAVNAYFKTFEREIRDHLRSLDKRLAQQYQVQFNLIAERGVAVKRIEATQAVISKASHVEDGAQSR